MNAPIPAGSLDRSQYIGGADVSIDGMSLRIIPGCGGVYAASACGSIYSLRRDRKLAEADSKGYRVVSISVGGACKVCKVHRLVMSAWAPNENGFQQVNHINGIKSDNRIENLEWSDPSAQQIHARKLGLIVTTDSAREASRRNIGDAGRKARKLTDLEAADIRNAKTSCAEAARIYSVSKSAIHAIRKGATYVAD